MASTEQHPPSDESLRLPEATSRRMIGILWIAAGIAFALGAIFAGMFGGGVESGGAFRRFFLGYLTAFGFALSIALGGLFFVLLQHVTRAGWSVAVRRVPEALAATLPVLGILSIPILATLAFPGASGSPTLYPWATPHEDSAEAELPLRAAPSQDLQEHAAGAQTVPEVVDSGERQPTQAVGESLTGAEHLLTREAITVKHARNHLHHDPLTAKKGNWLNRPFFLLRILIYFGVWTAVAAFYWRSSTLQDRSGDPSLTTRMQKWAPACLLLYAATVTGAAFDLWMSIDPHFYSTIFGGYIFAGSVMGSLAVIILIYQALRANGMLHSSISREHFHDLGKLLFAFVFFWGYIAFSQFMLIWYANVPETTYWFGVRGATTVEANHGMGPWPTDEAAPAPFGWWTIIVTTLLFAHLIIPFGGLLSRHVKRNSRALGFWAGWLLVMHYLDHYWLIMPEAMVGGWRVLPLPELALLVFMLGAVGGYFVWMLSGVSLRPAADPRLHESLAFHNL